MKHLRGILIVLCCVVGVSALGGSYYKEKGELARQLAKEAEERGNKEKAKKYTFLAEKVLDILSKCEDGFCNASTVAESDKKCKELDEWRQQAAKLEKTGKYASELQKLNLSFVAIEDKSKNKDVDKDRQTKQK